MACEPPLIADGLQSWVDLSQKTPRRDFPWRGRGVGLHGSVSCMVHCSLVAAHTLGASLTDDPVGTGKSPHPQRRRHRPASALAAPHKPDGLLRELKRASCRGAFKAAAPVGGSRHHLPWETLDGGRPGLDASYFWNQDPGNPFLIEDFEVEIPRKGERDDDEHRQRLSVRNDIQGCHKHSFRRISPLPRRRGRRSGGFDALGSVGGRCLRTMKRHAEPQLQPGPR